MTQPSIPAALLPQGPASRCVINGKPLGWFSCSAYGMAMGISQATIGRQNPSGCYVRRLTGDTTGGLTLAQVATAARHWGVVVDVRTGSNVATTAQVAAALQAGRGVGLQIGTAPVIKTAFRSTAGAINHYVHLAYGRGWSGGVPAQVLVYDSAADGRTASWGKAVHGPSWWPWSLVLAAAAALHPWGEGDPRTLGSGRAYAGLFPDTEPHIHSRYGGNSVAPLPTVRHSKSPATGRQVNVRSGPHTSDAVVATMTDGTPFAVWQVTHGQLLAGSDLWYGNHDGTRWVHSSGLV